MIGAKNADKEEIANETADVLYHLAVMLVETGLALKTLKPFLKPVKANKAMSMTEKK